MDELAWNQLREALGALAREQRFALDEVKLQGALLTVTGGQAVALTPELAEQVCLQAGWVGARSLPKPLRERLPLLVLSRSHGWGMLTQGLHGDEWLLELPGQQAMHVGAADLACVLRLLPPDAGAVGAVTNFEGELKKGLKSFRGPISESILASVMVNLLAVVVSFFSMQVYDKVIPTRSTETLVALLGGVLMLILFEWLMKWARSKVMDRAVVGLDIRLGREIFERLLSVRLDQMPASVGSLASQLRGYEQVRSFYTASTLFALVDVPAAVIFLLVISWIASPLMAVVPLVLGVAALVVGLAFRRKVQRMAAEGQREVNMKTGMLVETVEGAETIKSTHGGWMFLSKWIDLCNKTIFNDLKMRHTSDSLQYFMASMQQFSFVLLISLGAVLVIEGVITQGGLIACSILGGRILSAVMMLPSLMVQHAHARVAMNGVEGLYKLETDTTPGVQPLTPSVLRGNYLLEDVSFAYGKAPPAVAIKRLVVSPGERIGILGTVGSGKSTLLRMVAGLYRPTEGRVLIDGLDVSHVARETMSRHVCYVQQDHRLFEGTLRQNLLIGLPNPGDDAIKAAMMQTGLLDQVASHPMGLDLPISEGGRGLSGGQKQLLVFTRMVLAQPKVMLLDEPTASMDGGTEMRCLNALVSPQLASSTLLLVTHKPSVLSVVNRVLVVSRGQIVMDGPRDAVLAQLSQNSQAQADSASKRPAQMAVANAVVEV
ncbi:ATP-binding cassette domain-containing protein [Limnohabitans sp. T6-20]|uniref:ATP-binding cassette domain-containing protein n=1 Tax=Limnohabitans sp. T6-20 TaxID=1100725 RepID=UPI001304E291|nr:ATP-binding cassette domain-containing protein [Limnohabitans sp. T6-20]